MWLTCILVSYPSFRGKLIFIRELRVISIEIEIRSYILQFMGFLYATKLHSISFVTVPQFSSSLSLFLHRKIPLHFQFFLGTFNGPKRYDKRETKRKEKSIFRSFQRNRELLVNFIRESRKGKGVFAVVEFSVNRYRLSIRDIGNVCRTRLPDTLVKRKWKYAGGKTSFPCICHALDPSPQKWIPCCRISRTIRQIGRIFPWSKDKISKHRWNRSRSTVFLIWSEFAKFNLFSNEKPRYFVNLFGISISLSNDPVYR